MSIEPVAWLRGLQDALGRPPEFPDADVMADKCADLIDELQRQLAEAQDLASQINTDWIPANKKLAEQLAECEAAIERIRKVHAMWNESEDTAYGDFAMYEIDAILAATTDHTALDETIKQAKVEVLEEAITAYFYEPSADANWLRRMADEIRRG